MQHSFVLVLDSTCADTPWLYKNLEEDLSLDITIGT